MIAAASLAESVLTGVVAFVIGACVLTILMVGALRRAAEHDAIMRRPAQHSSSAPSSTYSNRTNINVTVHGGIHITNNGASTGPSIDQVLAALPANALGRRYALGSTPAQRAIDTTSVDTEQGWPR